MSSVGYQNKKRSQLSISLNSLGEFLDDLELATNTKSKNFSKIYESTSHSWPQLNANLLQIEAEFYETVRPKSKYEIKKRLNELFTPVVPRAIGIELDIKTSKFKFPALDLPLESEAEPGSEAGIKTVHGPSILKYINIASYNYPLDTEKDEQFQQLDDNFYSFYNGSEGKRKTKYDDLVKSLVTNPDLEK